jgi:hypothetical protein
VYDDVHQVDAHGCCKAQQNTAFHPLEPPLPLQTRQKLQQGKHQRHQDENKSDHFNIKHFLAHLPLVPKQYERKAVKKSVKELG